MNFFSGLKLWLSKILATVKSDGDFQNFSHSKVRSFESNGLKEFVKWNCQWEITKDGTE
jgi:hypothetical protein